jgi:hypothetical protein
LSLKVDLNEERKAFKACKIRVVPAGGLEPPQLALADFESAVSTISPRRLKSEIIVTYCLNLSYAEVIFADIVQMELILLK